MIKSLLKNGNHVCEITEAALTSVEDGGIENGFDLTIITPARLDMLGSMGYTLLMEDESIIPVELRRCHIGSNGWVSIVRIAPSERPSSLASFTLRD